MKNHGPRRVFHDGTYPHFPQPGMDTLGRPISGPDGLQQGQMKGRPVLGAKGITPEGMRKKQPAPPEGVETIVYALGRELSPQ